MGGYRRTSNENDALACRFLSAMGITACSHRVEPALTLLSPACSVQEWRVAAHVRRSPICV